MPAKNNKHKSSKVPPQVQTSLTHALPKSFLTPEKKTKAVNYSPGKKPSRS